MFGYSPVSAAVATQIVRTRTNLWQAPAPATSLHVWLVAAVKTIAFQKKPINSSFF